LVLLILGIGAFKPNISTQVGALYAPDDRRRARAYSIFYVGINIGAFLSPLVCGTLAASLGWHYGFAAAGVGMLISLAIYAYGWRALPADEAPREKTVRGEKTPLAPNERRAVLALIGVCALVTFFWAAYDQQGNTLVLWAEDFTDRSIDLYFWKGEIPSSWFLALNPLMIFLFTPAVVWLWAYFAPNDPMTGVMVPCRPFATPAASSSASGNTYTGCLNPGGNVLHVAVGPLPGHPCSSNQLQISWNQAGPMGPQGPQGPAGPAGPVGPAGPAGGGALGFYQRSVQFVCPGSAGDPNCLMPDPPLVASCDAGDVATGGYWFVQNMDSTNFVELRSGTAATDFIKLLAGEWAVFRTSADAAAPFAIANSSACNVRFVMFDA
jgi:MFS family permease